MRAIGRFVSRNPFLTALIVLAIFCVAFGPGTVGAWCGSTGREVIVGGVRFVTSLVAGAF